MKKLSLILIAALTMLLAACAGSGPSASGQGKGSAVFTVSDAAADMGAVSDIHLTVEGLRVRNQAGVWTTVDIDHQTFALLELRDRGAAELLATAELEAGAYDRLELQVSEVVVVDNRGSHEASLPSNTLTLEGTLEVVAGTTATADFDFLADQSLHLTSEGSYVFAPVVLLETRSRADAEVRSNNEVVVSGGSVRTRVELGMDVMGNVDAGLRVTPDAVLTIGASGRPVQTGGQALVSGTIKAVDTVEGTVTIATAGGADVILHLASDTAVRVDGSTRNAADLAAHIDARANVQYNAASKAISSLAAGASADARAEAGTNLKVSGVIQSVDTANGTVTVLTDAGTEVVLRAGSSFTINLGGSLLSGLLGLQAEVGSRIDANYDARTGAITQMEAEGNAAAQTHATANGTLKAVDRLMGRITVTTESGADVIVSLPATARVVVGGSVSTMAALATRIGSDVSVRYNTQTNVASEVRAEGSAGGQATISETLEGVNTLPGTITVVGETGARLVLNVGTGTQVLLDGAAGSVAGLSSKVGGRATVTYNAETNVANSVRVESQGSANVEATVTGTLKSVNVASGSITVATETGADLVLSLSSSAQVLVGGSVSTVAVLATQVGSQVTVAYNTETKVASRVTASSAGGGSLTGPLSGGTTSGTSGSAASGAGTETHSPAGSADAQTNTSVHATVQ